MLFWNITMAYPCLTTQAVVADAHPVRVSIAAAGRAAATSTLFIIDFVIC
jgi:hypothetical protein